MAFGIWDIFYYIFLVPMCGWPRSLLDWDILFLIPLPWWGPVISPVLIAALMIIGGTFITQIDEPNAPFMPRLWSMIVASIGAMLALYIFMTDALRVANQGVHVIRATLPTAFNWNLFIVALALMAAPIVNMIWQLGRRNRKQPVPC
jgi:hypothetical protein